MIMKENIKFVGKYDRDSGRGWREEVRGRHYHGTLCGIYKE